MFKKIYCFIIVILLLIGAVVHAQIKIPDSKYPPVISEVTFSPQDPAEGQDVTVTAKVYYTANTDDSIVAVYLIYTKDGGQNWDETEMEQSKDNEKEWNAQIAGAEGVEQTLFYIHAKDTSGNMATEIPGMVKPENENSWIPLDSTMALVVQDEDDSPQLTADALDLLNIYAGIDEQYLYIKLETQKPIDNVSKDLGMATPMLIGSFSSIDKSGYWNYKYGRGTHYVHYTNGRSGYGGSTCMIGIYDANREIEMPDYRKIDCMAKNKFVYLRIDKKNIEDDIKNGIKMFFYSQYKPSVLIGNWLLADATPFSHLYLRTHSIKYKKEAAHSK